MIYGGGSCSFVDGRGLVRAGIVGYRSHENEGRRGKDFIDSGARITEDA